MPLLVAPVALQRVAHPEGEVAMARAAKAAGTIMCLSTIATAAPAEVAAVGGPRWFQLYVFRDEGVTRELIAQARGMRATRRCCSRSTRRCAATANAISGRGSRSRPTFRSRRWAAAG